LVYRFALFYYPHFPILEPVISVAPLYRSSPFLFWTIIVTVSARHILPSHVELFKEIKGPYSAQLPTYILTSPLPLHIVQGLCYLIMWPMPTEGQPKEPSWLYCGLTVNAALYMGLHRSSPAPSLKSIGVVPGSIRARATTWLGCFLASTS
jgi:hypothetical protein